MKTRAMVILLLAAASLSAQPRWRGDGKNQFDRLDKFRKMKLIEALKLNEEDAVRFFAKQSAHEDKVRELMKSRNEAVDDLEKAARDDSDQKNLGPLADKLMATDQKIFEERQRYQNEMRQFLTIERFARFLVFERNFGRQVRDALEELHQDRRNR